MKIWNKPNMIPMIIIMSETDSQSHW
jgi:hypothetical protein